MRLAASPVPAGTTPVPSAGNMPASSQNMSSQVKSSQVKSSQVKSSHAQHSTSNKEYVLPAWHGKECA